MVIAAVSISWSIPAFPGAEGFGANAEGGRGGAIIEVTNLNDNGAGSFRAALNASGPRIVVFRTGGTIELKNGIDITEPYITIAGQTAPGGGITLKCDSLFAGAPLKIKAHDVVIRYLRFRSGQKTIEADSGDALSLVYGYNIIIDHCSISWATDECLGMWIDTAIGGHEIRDVTVQWCILSEGLIADMVDWHSMGSLLGHGVLNLSVHHNLYASNNERNPRIKTNGVVDFVNNVIYNYGDYPGQCTDEYSQVPINYVGNYVKSGPNSRLSAYELRLLQTTGNGFSVYVKDNIGPHRTNDSQADNLVIPAAERQYLTTTRHSAPLVTTTSAMLAYQQVLANAGVQLHVQDSVDKRIMNEVINHTGSIILSPSEVGGWPVLAMGTPPIDSDHDGMPDEWENSKALNPMNPADANQDPNHNGYTNIEEYLNELGNFWLDSLPSLQVLPANFVIAYAENTFLTNYPNPFNPRTNIVFNLPSGNSTAGKNYRLRIYNSYGQLVHSRSFSNNMGSVIWNAQGLNSGVYFVEVRGGNSVASKTIVLTK